MRAVTALAMALMLLASGVSGAAAAPVQTREEITGEVLRLVSVQDRQAMRTMAPGEPVTWDVHVSANRPDGEIALSLTASDPEDVFTVQVDACAAEGKGCGEQLLAVTGVGAEAVAVGTQPAAEEVWYRITTELVAPEAGAELALRFVAAGSGEEVTAGGGGDLPETGASSLVPVLGGVLLAMVLTVAGVLLRFGGVRLGGVRLMRMGAVVGRAPGKDA